MFWTLPTAFLTGTAAAGGLALINSLGNLGGYVGANVVSALRDGSDYSRALQVLGVSMLAPALVALAVSPRRMR